MTEKAVLTITKQMLEQFSELFHTAQRKGLDSDYSVISWNITNLVHPAIFTAFCEYMIEELKKHKTIDTLQFKKILKRWDHDKFIVSLFGKRDKDSINLVEELNRPKEHRIINIFTATMKAFPDEDIEQILWTMKYWTTEEFAAKEDEYDSPH